MRHFAGEAFETLTDVDSTAWRTLRTLLFRPGKLTAEYMRGVRVPYMKPLQFFLIVNVIYFVWVGWAGERVFSTTLANHVNQEVYGPRAREMVRARVSEPGMDTDAISAAANRYAERFDGAAAVQAKTLIITMVPMFAGLLALVQIARRRQFVQHLVFALHAYTALLVFSIMQRYVLQWPPKLAGRLLGFEVTNAFLNNLVSYAMTLGIGLYLVLGIRRAYEERWRTAIPKGLLLGVSMLFILIAYRVVLFFTVFWMT
ncbi:MAG: DUF3667 domain-containing protein [Gemmatimonadaceae bacterium]|nr:DUF3667 domain-containing protein [Gemmatimonadaceae bacterium]